MSPWVARLDSVIKVLGWILSALTALAGVGGKLWIDASPAMATPENVQTNSWTLLGGIGGLFAMLFYGKFGKPVLQFCIGSLQSVIAKFAGVWRDHGVDPRARYVAEKGFIASLKQCRPDDAEWQALLVELEANSDAHAIFDDVENPEKVAALIAARVADLPKVQPAPAVAAKA